MLSGRGAAGNDGASVSAILQPDFSFNGWVAARVEHLPPANLRNIAHGVPFNSWWNNFLINSAIEGKTPARQIAGPGISLAHSAGCEAPPLRSSAVKCSIISDERLRLLHAATPHWPLGHGESSLISNGSRALGDIVRNYCGGLEFNYPSLWLGWRLHENLDVISVHVSGNDDGC